MISNGVTIIENRYYLAWFHIPISQGAGQQLADLYARLSNVPGEDRYEIVLEDQVHQALLTPQNNKFRYSERFHKGFEKSTMGKISLEVLLVERPPSLVFDSPIEQAFWDAWNKCRYDQDHQFSHDTELIPQYPILNYRVDFAHPLTNTVIELDGLASHSSTEDIARDRKRQREIEDQGWHVIRFGGKEIHRVAYACAQETWNRIIKRAQVKP